MDSRPDINAMQVSGANPKTKRYPGNTPSMQITSAVSCEAGMWRRHALRGQSCSKLRADRLSAMLLPQNTTKNSL
jgi:hypothetical protein